VRVIPVIDVMGGVVVRAIGGRREEYRPIWSQLVESVEPLAVARALLNATGSAELYVADLGAIAGHPTLDLNVDALRRMTRLAVTVWVDAGLREDFDETSLLDAGVGHFVIGTETANGPGAVEHLAMLHGPDRVALSVDFRGGELVGNWGAWGASRDEALALMIDFAREFGITRLIVLDLSYVGELMGPGTGAVCQTIKLRYPDAEVWTGGGIRDWDDVRRLENAGADAVLVASALHDGTLTFPRPLS
jgi:phosphoribosylformimino-5-aminoimidazole carboxamide ribotide isomerase